MTDSHTIRLTGYRAWSFTVRLVEDDNGFDVTTADIRFQVRSSVDAATTAVDLSDGAGITAGADGNVTMELSDAAVTALSPSYAGVYELTVDDESWLTGRFVVSPGVVR